MNTRRGREHIEGIYLENDIEDIPRFMTSFFNQLKYLVLQKLKMRKSTFQSGNFLIEKRIFEYLKNTFGLTGHYKKNISLVYASQLITTRFVNETDYCTFEPDRFEVRICKQGDDTYYDENFQEQTNSSNMCRFFFRFTRQDLVKS